MLQSVAEATQEEIEKIDMEYIDFDSKSQEDASKPGQISETLMRTIAAVGAIAAAVTLVAITPIGPWLADEFAIVGATVAKVSALIKAIMERIPWPQPMHGEKGLWETITILFTSVIVRSPTAHVISRMFKCFTQAASAQKPLLPAHALSQSPQRYLSSSRLNC